MKKKLVNLFISKVRSPWPLTLSLGLLFCIYFFNKEYFNMFICFNIFLFILFLLENITINLDSVTFLMLSSTITKKISNNKFRDYITIISINKPKNKNTYNSHPKQHNAYIDFETNDLIIAESTISSSLTTKGKENVNIGLDNNIAYLVISKLKYSRLSTSDEIKNYLTFMKETQINYNLRQDIDFIKLNELMYQGLEKEGFKVLKDPIVDWSVEMEVYLNVISDYNFGKELVEITNNIIKD